MLISRDSVSTEKVKQKRYYDKRARERTLEVGKKALSLLPTSSNKLQATWKGSYEVVAKVGPVDYKLNVRGKDKMYHINMLKPWNERCEEFEDP